MFGISSEHNRNRVHNFSSKSLTCFPMIFSDHKHGIEINTNTLYYLIGHIYTNKIIHILKSNFDYLACYTFIQYVNIFHNSYLIHGYFSFAVNYIMYVFFIIYCIYTYCILFPDSTIQNKQCVKFLLAKVKI